MVMSDSNVNFNMSVEVPADTYKFLEKQVEELSDWEIELLLENLVTLEAEKARILGLYNTKLDQLKDWAEFELNKLEGKANPIRHQIENVMRFIRKESGGKIKSRSYPSAKITSTAHKPKILNLKSNMEKLEELGENIILSESKTVETKRLDLQKFDELTLITTDNKIVFKPTGEALDWLEVEPAGVNVTIDVKL